MFGILKAQFRCLKVPVLWQDAEKVDNMFHTCCILHNMLLEWSGLEEAMVQDALAGREWSNEVYDANLVGVKETWHDWEDCGRYRNIVNKSVQISAMYDASGCGLKGIVTDGFEETDGVPGWRDLREKLIHNFTYRCKKMRHTIMWPSFKLIK
jgi:hypothetical protein